MVEKQESSPVKSLEAPYITAVKTVVKEKMPDQVEDFNKFFDLMNNELMGNGEGKGLFIWESKVYEGVSFLAAHIHISESWIQKLSSNNLNVPKRLNPSRKDQIRFIQPANGHDNDGSGLSVLDMAFSPSIDIAHLIATAITDKEEPPTGDIYLLGSPRAIGGKTTNKFNDLAEAGKDFKDKHYNALGFYPHGVIYAEFMEEFVPENEVDLLNTRIVLEGVSKGTVTADRTYHHLSQAVKDRTQVLLDNVAGVHGSNLPTKIGRGANLLLFLAEVGVRFKNPIGKELVRTQPQFYKDISEKLGIAPDTEEEKKLKASLEKIEYMTLWHGTPIDKSERKFVRIPTPDPANISFKAMRRAFSFGRQARPRAIQDLAYQEGEAIFFPNSNKVHMWNWERNIESGSWSRKMKRIVSTEAVNR
jgi:hypothetical protein